MGFSFGVHDGECMMLGGGRERGGGGGRVSLGFSGGGGAWGRCAIRKRWQAACQ